MGKSLEQDARQKAFKSVDGCADGVLTLDLVLRHHHQCYKHLFLASLDIAKAFDSVSHTTIQAALRGKGVPPPMLQYLHFVYDQSTTKLKGDTWSSHSIKPLCGVKQGDPLSPLIFNCVIDWLLHYLPSEIGSTIGETNINAIAFADDLVLFASTERGLQSLIDVAHTFITSCGMTINTAKSSTIAIKNVPHAKRSVVVPGIVFSIGGDKIKSLKRSDTWTYLGITFTPGGKVSTAPALSITSQLDKLTRAPLKPQQRLFGLRVMILPKYYHQLVWRHANIDVGQS
jgi:Reverse transcriptase (RNA-dependent DNA polymerase).